MADEISTPAAKADETPSPAAETLPLEEAASVEANPRRAAVLFELAKGAILSNREENEKADAARLASVEDAGATAPLQPYTPQLREADKIVAWLDEAIALGSIDAAAFLGEMLLDGHDLGLDVEKGMVTLRGAAAKGHAEARRKLALVLMALMRGADDKVIARTKAEAKAAKEAATATATATAAFTADAADSSESSAASATSSSMDEEDEADFGGACKEGQRAVGTSLALGPKFGPIAQEAFVWLCEQAQAGDATAMFYISECFRCGWMIEASAKTAETWLQRAVDAGNAPALVAMGTTLYHGIGRRGLGADKERAVLYFRMAADKGHVDAQVNLAIILLEDLEFGAMHDAKEPVVQSTSDAPSPSPCEGSPMKDDGASAPAPAAKKATAADKRKQLTAYKEAAHWLTTATESGSVEAPVILGTMALDDVLEPANVSKADALFLLAARRGSRAGVMCLNKLRNKEQAKAGPSQSSSSSSSSDLGSGFSFGSSSASPVERAAAAAQADTSAAVSKLMAASSDKTKTKRAPMNQGVTAATLAAQLDALEAEL